VIVSVAEFPAASHAFTTMAFAPAFSPMLAMVQLVVPDAVPEPPVAWFVHVTEATPMLSEAFPPSEMVGEAVFVVGEEVGDVMVHVGLVLSRVTVIVSEPTFPAASRARTRMTFAPATSATLATLQLVVPVALPEVPVVSFVQVTAVTATSSEAVPPRARFAAVVAYVGDDVGVVIVHVGGVVSAAVRVTVMVSLPLLATASHARTTMVLAPIASAMPAWDQLVVPPAVPAAPFAWFVQVTEVTPMLSEAVPPMFTVAAVVFVVGEEVGAVIVQVGFALS
jgi:hypothetical protein